MCSDDTLCLPVYVRCNGVNDCPGREDEAGCENYTCPGFYRCYSSAVCVHVDNVCDGWPQCPQHDDERFCQLTCPEGCSCRGLVFTCVTVFPAHEHIDLRYLQASGSGVTPAHLTHNLMLIHLDLSRCNLTDLGQLSLPNLRTLVLSDNLLHNISATDLLGVMNLRSVTLAGNPLTSLFADTSEGFSFLAMTSLDMSRVALREIDLGVFALFPNLKSLNLSQCGVKRAVRDNITLLSELRWLDLSGCPGCWDFWPPKASSLE
nr:hypothetical protein BaRGS_014752 [Batillaria attramentaria]